MDSDTLDILDQPTGDQFSPSSKVAGLGNDQLIGGDQDQSFAYQNPTKPIQTKSKLSKKKVSRVQIASYVLGALALAVLIAAAFLLAFVRDNSTVYTVVSVSSTVTPSPPPPLNEITLQMLFGDTIFTYTDFNGVIIPIVSVGPDPFPSITVTHPNPYGPGEIPFADTIALPLQTPPQGMGYCVITPDASQFLTSFENGNSAFGQYFSVTAGGVTGFEVYKDGYNPQTLHNFVYFNCPGNDPTGSTTPPAINEYASAVGSVGYASMGMSIDGLRLYVAYRSPFMGSNDSSQVFPLLQTVGRVAVYVITKTGDNDWQYKCSLGLQNPFGSQTAGLETICDATKGSAVLLTGDDFGSIIRTSVNLTNGNRMVACRANYGFAKRNGALISIYEETGQDTPAISGVLQLFDHYAPLGGFNFASKLAFGNDFNVSDDTVLAAVRVPLNDCYGTVVGPVNQVLFFRRNETSLQWEFKQIINTPNVLEDFGTSIVISNDAKTAIIGAPTLPTSTASGIGGHIYVYVRSNDGNSWSLNQTVSDPNASVNLLGAFGYFLSVDPLFLVVSVSTNQRNQLNLKPTITIGDTPNNDDKPKITLMAIKQLTSQVDSANNIVIYQPSNVSSDLLDPLLGCNMAMSFSGNTVGGALNICVNSPLNRLVKVQTMMV